jgi:hypothetical protein
MPNTEKRTVYKRNDEVSAQIHAHFKICKDTGVKLDKKHWYEHVPKSVKTSQGGKVRNHIVESTSIN